MFVVAGITGNTGGAVASALLAAGQQVRAIMRTPARAAAWAARGVDVVEGDLGDPEALARAFEGTEGAYLLAPPSADHPDPVGNYARIGQAVRNAAQSAGLPKLVFLSSEGAHLPSGTGIIGAMHAVEQVLFGLAGLTLLRPSYFQENWQAMFHVAAAQGILPTMLALERKRDMVATLDIGRTAASLLLELEAPAIVELAGPEAYDPHEVASAASVALGRAVTAVQPPRGAWAGILKEAGVGEAYATLLAEMYDGINFGHVRFSGEAEHRRGAIGIESSFAAWRPAEAA